MLDLSDAVPQPKVGDRLSFRMSYGALLAVMTSEYVEKVPMHEVEHPHRRASGSLIDADAEAQGLLAEYSLDRKLGDDRLRDRARPPSSGRRPARSASCGRPDLRLARADGDAARASHSLGLIWIDPAAPPAPQPSRPPNAAVGASARARPRPQLAPSRRGCRRRIPSS